MFQFGYVRLPNFFSTSTLLTVPSAIPLIQINVSKSLGDNPYFEKVQGGVVPSPPEYLRMTRLGAIFLAGAKLLVAESRFEQS